MNRWRTVVLAIGILLATPPAAIGQSNLPSLPGLQVECVGCRLRQPVTRAIVHAYEDAAEYEGFAVDRSTWVRLRITEVAQRDPAAASLFGMLAGSDRLKGTLVIGERNIEVEDSTSSTFGSLETVAESLGITVQKHVAEALKKK